MLAASVYILCALTSSLCAAALLGSYRAKGTRLLLWSGLGFVGLAANNILLVVDVLIVPESDLLLFRTLPALAGVTVLLWGFVWDTA